MLAPAGPGSLRGPAAADPSRLSAAVDGSLSMVATYGPSGVEGLHATEEFRAAFEGRAALAGYVAGVADAARAGLPGRPRSGHPEVAPGGVGYGVEYDRGHLFVAVDRGDRGLVLAVEESAPPEPLVRAGARLLAGRA